MLIVILVLQIISLVLGIVPVAMLFTYLIFDFHRESKEKRARERALRESENLDETTD